MTMHLQDRRGEMVLLDFGRSSVRLCMVRRSGAGACFRRVVTFRIDAPVEMLEPEQWTALEEDLAGAVLHFGIKGYRAGVQIAGAQTSVRSLAMPPMPAEDLNQAASLKLAGHLPFQVDHAQIRVIPQGEQGEKSGHVLVVAAETGYLERIAGMVRSIGLVPAFIGHAVMGMATLLASQDDERRTGRWVHAHIGKASTLVTLYDGAVLRSSRELLSGGDEFTRALVDLAGWTTEGISLSQEQAEEVKILSGLPEANVNKILPSGLRSDDVYVALEPIAQALSDDLDDAIALLLQGVIGVHVERLLISGGGSRLHRLDRFLEDSLQIPTTCVDLIDEAEASLHIAFEQASGAAKAGLAALAGLALDPNPSINLLPPAQRRANTLTKARQLERAASIPAIAAGVVLAGAAVPLHRSHGQSVAAIRSSTEHLEVRLQAHQSMAQELSQARARLDTVDGMVSGPLVWPELMEELGARIPVGVQLGSVVFTPEADGYRGRFSAQLHADEQSDERLLSVLTSGLDQSPLLEQVQVDRANLSGAGETRCEGTFFIPITKSEGGQ